MEFDAIGTHWSIETSTPLSEALQKSIWTRIQQFDKTYSRFRNDSLVADMTTSSGTYKFPNDSKELVAFYKKMYKATHGAVTPLVGQTLNELGYDKTYSFKQAERGTTQVPNWDDVMIWKDETVTTEQPLILDFGAAGKGFLVDTIGELLERSGVKEYVIDASGDIRHRSVKQQVIGLEDPHDPSRVIGTVMLKNASLCASATNRRRWGDDIHHVIDGRTATPTEDIIATWVIADTTLAADGIATALFFSSPQSLHSLGSFQFVRMYTDGKVEHSHDFVGELFT